MNRKEVSVVAASSSSDPLPRARVHGRRWAAAGARLRAPTPWAAAANRVIVLSVALALHLAALVSLHWLASTKSNPKGCIYQAQSEIDGKPVRLTTEVRRELLDFF